MISLNWKLTISGSFKTCSVSMTYPWGILHVFIETTLFVLTLKPIVRIWWLQNWEFLWYGMVNFKRIPGEPGWNLSVQSRFYEFVNMSKLQSTIIFAPYLCKAMCIQIIYQYQSNCIRGKTTHRIKLQWLFRPSKSPKSALFICISSIHSSYH